MSQYKRKFDGPTIQEKRKVDQDPLKVPPHRKERKYKLTVEWTDVTTWRRTKEFTTRAALEEAKRRIQRQFAAKAKKEAGKQPVQYKYWGRPSAFAEFDDIQVTTIKTDPAYVESDI
jgi:hypothetical protein